MAENSIGREGNPIPRERVRMSEQIVGLVRDRYVQAVAGSIWAVNTAYNFFSEGKDALTSVLHGVTSPANTPLFNPTFQGEIGKLGAVSQGAMYFVVAGGAVGATAAVLDRRTQRREGRATITKGNSVILADCDGVPLFVDLGRQLTSGGRVKNLILSKTGDAPQRTSSEQEVFGLWVANAGGSEKDFFDTGFWNRSGAKDADAVVLNSSNTTASREAAVVIRDQLGNKEASIVIISNSSDDLTSTETDAKTGAHIVNPFVELTSRSIAGLLDGDVDLFMPQLDETLVSQNYREEVNQKRTVLTEKLAFLHEKSEPIKVFVHGDVHGREGKGLTAGFSRLNTCLVTTNPSEADVVFYFGSGEITDDSSVMIEDANDPFRTNEKVIKLRIPFDRDNEDNALGHGDGTISLERATNAKLAEILKPHIELRLSLKDRLSRAIRRGAGKKIRNQIAS